MGRRRRANDTATDMNRPLHETDFVRRTAAQGSALRAAGAMGSHPPLPIDRETARDGPGRTRRSERRGPICVILEHRITLTAPPGGPWANGLRPTPDGTRSPIARALTARR